MIVFFLSAQHLTTFLRLSVGWNYIEFLGPRWGFFGGGGRVKVRD